MAGKKTNRKTTKRKRTPKRPLPESLLKLLDKPEPEAAKIGRPSDYTQELGAKFTRLMGEGYSITAVAGALGLTRSVVYDWIDKHPEFSEAIERGKAARVFRLEFDMKHAFKPHEVTAARFSLVNACPGGREGDTWRDKIEIDHDTPPDSPLAQLARELAGTAIRPKEQ
jgi:hypothetical protein